MKPLHRVFALVVVAGSMCGPSAALSGLPDYSGSYIDGPPVLLLGGMKDEVVDPRVFKMIVIRSGSLAPIAGAVVAVNFTSCTNQDIRLCDAQPHHPGSFFNCPAKTVSAITNKAGEAFFRIAGGATNVAGARPPGSQTMCAEVRADGMLLGSIRVAAYDQNLIDGVNALDFARLLGDLFPLGANCGAAGYRNRSDLDGSCSVNALDASLMLDAVLPLEQVTSSCATVCP